MAKNKHVKPYQAKNGAQQWKPSIQMAMTLMHDMSGFCLACGAEVGNIEPDAGKYRCPACDAHKVYGAEQLVLMGLTFDAERGAS
jgi:DNA-directed RNA polymerase subunit RPC12/RpoP